MTLSHALIIIWVLGQLNDQHHQKTKNDKSYKKIKDVVFIVRSGFHNPPSVYIKARCTGIVLFFLTYQLNGKRQGGANTQFGFAKHKVQTSMIACT